MADETRSAPNPMLMGLENELFQNENIPFVSHKDVASTEEDESSQELSLATLSASTSASAVSDVSPSEDVNKIYPTDVSIIFSSLFPHLRDISINEIEGKLRNNSGDSKYKAKLLQECITNSLDDGYEVREEVFYTLDQWLQESEMVHNLPSTSAAGYNDWDIKLSEEKSPMIEIKNGEAVNLISIVESSGNNEDDILKDLSSLYSSSEQLSVIDNDSKCNEIAEVCDIENPKTIPQNVSLTSSSSEESISILVDEAPPLKSFFIDNASPDLQAIFNGLPEETKSWCLEKVDFLSEVNSALSKQYIFCQVIHCINEADINIVADRLLEESAAMTQSDSIQSNQLPQNCESQALGAVEDVSLEEPSGDIVSTEETPSTSSEDDLNSRHIAVSLASNSTTGSSDILLPEESMKLKDNDVFLDEPNLEECHNDLNTGTSDIEEIEENFPEEVSVVENVDNEVPWKEAEAVCHLLPFLHLKGVHQTIIDNYDHPQRKAKVLSEYIELSLEEGHEINATAFETLFQWQANFKRYQNDHPENRDPKRQKSCNENASQNVSIPSASSEESLDIPGKDEPVFPKSVVDEAASELQAIFHDLPEESKSWCLEKVDFLSEVTLSKQYIFSQVIHCRNEEDINIVADRLLEEAAAITERDSTQSNQLSQNLDTQELEAVGEDSLIEPSGESPSLENLDCSSMNTVLVADPTQDIIQDHICQLAEMFSDADPEFLSEKANALAGDSDKFAALVEGLLENHSYPKMEEYYERQKKENIQKRFSQCASVEEMVEYFEDPGGKPGTAMNDILADAACQGEMVERMNELRSQKEMEKETFFQIAKENGELQECQCCFDDEILIENMSTCRNSDNLHFFCNPCIKRYCEEQIGQGKEEFRCIEGSCTAAFSLVTLESVLPAAVFANLFKEKQQEELAAAGIEDLESCPFCNFATIMPNKDDKVFKCLNAKCLVDSCRLCKEVNHIPLRCTEVENKRQTSARNFVENEMTEAMVRECYKCRKRFIKEEGCNKMMCPCGAMMCYVCKVAIQGYQHFDDRTYGNGTGKCPLWTNSKELHAAEVRTGAEEAKMRLEPGVTLVHDPMQDFGL